MWYQVRPVCQLQWGVHVYGQRFRRCRICQVLNSGWDGYQGPSNLRERDWLPAALSWWWKERYAVHAYSIHAISMILLRRRANSWNVTSAFQNSLRRFNITLLTSRWSRWGRTILQEIAKTWGDYLVLHCKLATLCFLLTRCGSRITLFLVGTGYFFFFFLFYNFILK